MSWKQQQGINNQSPVILSVHNTVCKDHGHHLIYFVQCCNIEAGHVLVWLFLTALPWQAAEVVCGEGTAALNSYFDKSHELLWT